MIELKHSEAEITEKAQILVNLQSPPANALDFRSVLVQFTCRNQVTRYQVEFEPLYYPSETNWFGLFYVWKRYGSIIINETCKRLH